MRAGVHSLVGTKASRLGAGLERAPVPVALWVRQGDQFICVDVNDAMVDIADRPREQFIGATIDELGGGGARAKRDMLEATTSETAVQHDRTWVLDNGDVRQLQIAYVSLGPNELLAFAHDVTHQRLAEERLRVSEDRYQTLVTTANQGVWLVKQDGATVFANRQVARILDRPFNEIAWANLLTFVTPADRATVAGAIACPRDTPYAFEARFRRHDGTELLGLISVSPMPGEASANPDTLVVLTDLTKVQHERELRRVYERRFERIVETANEGVWTGNPQGRTTFMNEAAARALGVDRDEMLGKPYTDLVIFDERTEAARDKIMRDGVPIHGEFRLKRPAGGHIDVMASVSLLREDNGRVIGLLAMLTDITTMKQEQVELAESRQRFAQVFNEAPVGIAFIGAGHLVRGRFLAANGAFHEMLGYSEPGLLEQDIFSVTHPDDVEQERVLAAELFEHKRQEYSLDKRFVRADGTTAWARFRAHVLRDENGAPLYALGVAVDISAEHEASERVGALDARVAALLEGSRDAVIEVTRDGLIEDVNAAALLLFGVKRHELVAHPFEATLVPEHLRPRVIQALGDWFRAAEGGDAIEPGETIMRRVDGSEFPAEVRVAAVPGPDGSRLLVQIRNLGLRDSAEAGRREAEVRFERLFRDSPAAMATVDLSGHLMDVNPALCTLAGRESLQLVGRDAADVFADAGDATEFPWQSETSRSGPVVIMRRVTRPEGRAVAVRITMSLVRDATENPAQWLCHCEPQTVGSGPVGDHVGEALSYRERQVLGLLAQGHDGPAIAERLGLSPETVRSYTNSARDKLGAKTRTHAVALALVRGEVSV